VSRTLNHQLAAAFFSEPAPEAAEQPVPYSLTPQAEAALAEAEPEPEAGL